jgi:3',5'-cyclic AMP phosphodiesterase CpdA
MLAAITAGLALLALITPLVGAESPGARVGWLLAFAAAIEMLHGLRRATAQARRQAAGSALISLLIAFPLINASDITFPALRLLIAVFFAVDVVRCGIDAIKQKERRARRLAAAAALGNAAVLLLVVLPRAWVNAWVIALAGAARIAGITWDIITARIYATSDADQTIAAELGLDDQPEAMAIAAEVEAAETARAPIDRGWTIAFIVTLFAIHEGRMTIDRTMLSMVSPAVAVAGDVLIAVLISLLLITPAYVLFRAPTRWIERRIWNWYLTQRRAGTLRWFARATESYLRWSLALGIRMRTASYSLPIALSQSLQRGLPAAAIIAATVPLAGMSWYFDTENWASGMWNSWAASRTNRWREAMVTAVLSQHGGTATPSTFSVAPSGIESGDFSFIVIGDTGEGDASQHVLRDQLLSVASRDDVRFVVVSSDVVYPSGEMKDYEAKFWLPFKGVSKPVFAVPGNHDWYDALEAFAATFFEPSAARAAIRARVEADLRVTSTTDARVEDLINQAARLRDFYQVPTGFQRAPFFEIQTDRFALVAVDTGVLRTLDDAQQHWLQGALDRSAGKFTIVIQGHPFFAGGHDLTLDDESFAGLKRKLDRRGVRIVMAGDTHDLEYYAEPGADGHTSTHHFVNGGGGAYLSFGTALAWPAHPPIEKWAYYPSREAVATKIEARTPWWKRPAWFWVRQFDAWPFGPEWLSGVFDYNVAPFFQSFVEVRVERSANQVRVVPYGVHGRLKWGEIASSPALRTAGLTNHDHVEWVVPMIR